jgi:hypothetical protein
VAQKSAGGNPGGLKAKGDAGSGKVSKTTGGKGGGGRGGGKQSGTKAR